MPKKHFLVDELARMTSEQKLNLEQEGYVDYSPLDMLPDVIDKDYGFFLMFGKPDIEKTGTASTNYSSIQSTAGVNV